MIKIVISIIITFIIAHSSMASNLSTLSANIINLTPIITINENAKIVLILPAKDNNISKWRLYFGEQGHNEKEGSLTSNNLIQVIENRYNREGAYAILLVLFDEKNNPTYQKTANIKVEEGRLNKIIKSWGGPILGAILGSLLTIFAFVVQSVSKILIENRKRKKEFHAIICMFIKGAIEKTKADISINIPIWVENPGESGWSDIINKMGLENHILGLYEVLFNVKNAFVEKNKAISTLENILRQMGCIK